MLQPVGAAVEKAGGLPQLELRLDNSGLDRKPSIEEKPHPQGGSHDLVSGDDTDALLELLCDDDEEEGEEDLLLPPSLTNSRDRSESDTIGSSTFDSKFERLKKELMGGAKDMDEGAGREEIGSKYQNGQLDRSDDQIGSNNKLESLYENTKQSDSESDSRDYQNVTRSHDDAVLSGAPMFDGYQQNGTGDETFDLQENWCYEPISKVPPPDAGDVNDGGQCYESMSRVPPPDAAGDAHDGGRKGNVYQDVDAVMRYLEAEAQREAMGGRSTDEPPQGDPPHEYVDLDSVFADRANEEGHVYDTMDGGMLSRQVDPPPRLEQLELEEIVPFKNLPPLVCTARLGDEVAMRKLADTAAVVLSEVVKHIHTSLGKCLEQGVSQIAQGTIGILK